MSLFAELKRRNVFKVGIAYVIASWLLLQLTEVLTELLEIGPDVGKIVIVLLIVGFIPALIFAWAFELTPEGIKREHEVDRDQSIAHQTGRKLDFVIIGILTVGIAYLLIDKFTGDPKTDVQTDAQLAVDAPADAISSPELNDPAAAGESSADTRSIAVLPFVNMSDDASNEFFSDGISEEILNSLATIRDLKVAGRTSSFAFKGKDQDLRQIGEALGVAHILEGSVRKSGNKVRVTAQLIQVDNGFHMWSDTYDRELTDVFAIQDEIAGAILDQMKAQLLDGESAALASTRTNAEAYEKFLLARQRIYARKRATLESAVELLDQAIELDPAYAPAYAQRAIANLLLRNRQYGTYSSEVSDMLGKPDIDRALELDPGLAEGWAALGLYHQDRVGEHREAIEALEKALSINPNQINARNWLQSAYGNAGEQAKALAIIEEMIALDPFYRPGIGNATGAYIRLGRLEDAQALLNRVRRHFGEKDPVILNFQSRIFSAKGEYDEALPLVEEARRIDPDNGVYEAALGFTLWSLHEWERMAALSPPFQKIFALNKLGRREEATILAYEEAAEGDVSPLLALMNRTGRYADMVRFVEERWPDLDAFQAVYPSSDYGYWMMTRMAHAYAQTGNQAHFEDAMTRVRTVHDGFTEEGVDHWLFYWYEAVYYALAGDHEKALDFLDRSVSMGAIGDLKMADSQPEFRPLEGEARYEAIQARMVESLNRQRATLGLPPATI